MSIPIGVPKDRIVTRWRTAPLPTAASVLTGFFLGACVTLAGFMFGWVDTIDATDNTVTIDATLKLTEQRAPACHRADVGALCREGGVLSICTPDGVMQLTGSAR